VCSFCGVPFGACAWCAQDTITGFLLTGVGDASAGQPNNYMVVDQGVAQPLSPCLSAVDWFRHCLESLSQPRASLLSLRPLSDRVGCARSAETPQEAIEEKFKAFTTNDDISVILISQEIASQIRWLIDDFDSPVPSILEIPTKSKPYDPEQDPTYERIKRLLGGAD
jgi:vacuolar-type H+-ATPase subunit F/Vma7